MASDARPLRPVRKLRTAGSPSVRLHKQKFPALNSETRGHKDGLDALIAQLVEQLICNQ